MLQGYVTIEKKDKAARVTLNDPERLNALGSPMLRALDEAFFALDADQAVDVVIVTGAGRAFSGGADVAEMAAMGPAEIIEFSLAGHRLMSRIEGLRQPVIAAVNGYALGGGLELALACDLRLASDAASFGLPEVGLGVIPGWGGTQRLPRVVGQARARELIFTGRRIDAAEAAAIGLVGRVVPANTLLGEAHAMADTILRQSASAVQMAKRVLGLSASEAEALELLFSLPDQRARMSAFLERQRKRDERKKACQQ